jgi:hypothetical protein
MRSSLFQAVIVAAALGVLAALVYGSYIAEGGYNGIGIVRSLDFTRLAIQSMVLGSGCEQPQQVGCGIFVGLCMERRGPRPEAKGRVAGGSNSYIVSVSLC